MTNEEIKKENENRGYIFIGEGDGFEIYKKSNEVGGWVYFSNASSNEGHLPIFDNCIMNEKELLLIAKDAYGLELSNQKRLQELGKQAHENSVSKGFWDKPRNMGEMLMLIVSEISEAMEADRINNYHDFNTRYRIDKDLSINGAKWAFDIVDSNPEAWNNWFEAEVKNSFEDELADAMIRIMDLAFSRGIDLEHHIQMKMRYNKTRPHMHGGKKY